MIFVSIFMMLPYVTPVQEYKVPVKVTVEITPPKRVNFEYFGMYMLPYDHDEYLGENPTLGSNTALTEDEFLTRKYHHISKFTMKHKGKGGLEGESEFVLDGKGEYMIYFFFRERSMYRVKRTINKRSQEHFFIKKVWYGGKGDLSLDLDMNIEELGKPPQIQISVNIG